jgi:hypothetical protein
MELEELIGKKLEGFEIVEMTKVYKGNEDGREIESFGFFKSERLAKAFAGNQTNSSYFHTQKVLVLTNGEIGFLMGKPESVQFVDDEALAVETKEKILKKLSDADRAFLKL